MRNHSDLSVSFVTTVIGSPMPSCCSTMPSLLRIDCIAFARHACSTSLVAACPRSKTCRNTISFFGKVTLECLHVISRCGMYSNGRNKCCRCRLYGRSSVSRAWSHVRSYWRPSPHRSVGDRHVVCWHVIACLFRAFCGLVGDVSVALCVFQSSASTGPSMVYVATSSSFCVRALVVSSWCSGM